MLRVLVLSVVLASGVAAKENSAQLSRQEVEQILCDFRVGGDYKLREANIGRLAGTGETYVPLLVECLKPELPGWLTSRIQQAERLRQPVPMRADMSSVGIQGCAEAVLIRIGKPALPRLMDSLRDQPETIGAVARMLGGIGDRRAIPALIDVLKDDKHGSWTRTHVASALQRLDAQEAIPYLIEALRRQPDDPQGSSGLADSASDALATLTGQSFGFALVIAQPDMGWDTHLRYVIRGTPEEKEAIIARWRQWWERHSTLRDQVECFLAMYASRLEDGDAEKIKAMRSPDYVRRVGNGNTGLVVVDNPRGEWFDAIQRRSASSAGCEDYQMGVLSCRFEGQKAIVTSHDAAIIIDGVKASFPVIFERVLERQGDSWLMKEENLLTWEQPKYGG